MVSLARTSPPGEVGGGHVPPAVAPVVDHDRVAATGRSRRSIVDIDRVVALAAAHGDDPDWNEVAVLLGHLRSTLSYDLENSATSRRGARHRKSGRTSE
jgi:hypothetical protein